MHQVSYPVLAVSHLVASMTLQEIPHEAVSVAESARNEYTAVIELAAVRGTADITN